MFVTISKTLRIKNYYSSFPSYFCTMTPFQFQYYNLQLQKRKEKIPSLSGRIERVQVYFHHSSGKSFSLLPRANFGKQRR